MNHERGSWPVDSCPRVWHPCQRRAALTPRGRLLHSSPDFPAWHLTWTAAHRSVPCSRLSNTPHISASLQGELYSPSRRVRERPRCSYSASLPVIAHSRFLTPTSLRPSQVLPKRFEINERGLQLSSIWQNFCLTLHACARTGFRGARIP